TMSNSSSPYTETITDLLQLLTDAGVISHDNQERAKAVAHNYLEQHSDFISITWDVDDVKAVARDRNLQLTNEHCLDVLDYIESNHDANIGISWDSVHFALDSMDFD
ncbi:hypothetical protein I4641_02265, partial [Waterburya agarophytonicola K14]